MTSLKALWSIFTLALVLGNSHAAETNRPATRPIWTGKKDTLTKKIPDSELFKNVLVRTVPVSAVVEK